jgi:hypothetical protein
MDYFVIGDIHGGYHTFKNMIPKFSGGGPIAKQKLLDFLPFFPKKRLT